LILGGSGDDCVNALLGGFSGTGTTDLGEGNDTLKGFGSGSFDGGAGTQDAILFGEGVYTISGGLITRTGSGAQMNVSNFEFIGGAAVGGQLIAFANGTLTIDANGNVLSFP
jgi:hypothetical protein